MAGEADVILGLYAFSNGCATENCDGDMDRLEEKYWFRADEELEKPHKEVWLSEILTIDD